MTDAIQFANDRPTSLSDDLYQWAVDAEDLIRKQDAEIAGWKKDQKENLKWQTEQHAEIVALKAEVEQLTKKYEALQQAYGLMCGGSK